MRTRRIQLDCSAGHVAIERQLRTDRPKSSHANRSGWRAVPLEERESYRWIAANADHGLRRTNSDKRKAVLTLLQDEEWSTGTDHEIARQMSDNSANAHHVRVFIENRYQ